MSGDLQKLRTGLVSVTFRALDVPAIIALARKTGLETIEWGGDVHVPHGDLGAARDARSRGEDAGIAVSAYGSYYRAGVDDPKVPKFEDVLSTAVALGAPVIRVWAGVVGSDAASAADRSRVEHDLARICAMAAAEGVTVSLEYHGGTLTDSPTSALSLLEAVARPNLASYWQPRHGLSVEENLADIALLRPYLRDVHVFHWWPDGRTRHPLSDGATRWQRYLADLASDGRAHTVSLEFVRGDDPNQLVDDAKTLGSLLSSNI